MHHTFKDDNILIHVNGSFSIPIISFTIALATFVDLQALIFRENSLNALNEDSVGEREEKFNIEIRRRSSI